ncbi:MAG TPA: P63C domain-containing protein [Gemmatimonadaceae bacterium]
MHNRSSIEVEPRNVTPKTESHAAELGRKGGIKGGRARAEALSPEQRSQIASDAARARWGERDVARASYMGVIKIGERQIDCAVLEDGTRVLTRATMLKAIGRTGKAKGGRRYDEEFQLPVFLTADNLSPFIPADLAANSKPIPIMHKGVRALGYRAELLPQVCQVFLDAKDAGVLRPNQKPIAEACKALYRGLAGIGIIALVDEATGFQGVRDRDALQKILDKFLQDFRSKWAKTFPDEFYEQLFRLRGWQYSPVSVKRPVLVGKLTNDLIYARLAPGVLTALKKLNPPDKVTGRRPDKNFQWLSQDHGIQALREHLSNVIFLMRGGTGWAEFYRALNRAAPKYGDTLALPFTEGD